MEFKGKIIAVLPSRSGVSKAGKPWTFQEYVIESSEQYARKMCFQVFGDEKIKQFNIQVGDMLNVSFEIDARQWNDRWFNSIRALKVERVSAQPAKAAQRKVNSRATEPRVYAPSYTDDLPF